MEMVHFIPPGQRRLAMLAAQADTAPALISGASGTGKGAIARWIHSNSPRTAHPFLTATRDRSFISQIAEAQGGTMVIPDIGEWPLGEQKAILNFLKTKSVPHAGNTSLPILLNVRLIATTDQVLEGRAQGGLFNPELLARLNVFRIEMPPLVRRMEEFDDIALGVLGEITREVHKEYLRTFSAAAWDSLRSYQWPGNIRELRNVLRMAVIASRGDQIEAHDLPDLGSDRIDFRATREQFERTYLLEILRTFDWDVERTCQIAQMDRATLIAKMQQYGIGPQRETSPEPTL
jgi:two-component system response regulator HydG